MPVSMWMRYCCKKSRHHHHPRYIVNESWECAYPYSRLLTACSSILFVGKVCMSHRRCESSRPVFQQADVQCCHPNSLPILLDALLLIKTVIQNHDGNWMKESIIVHANKQVTGDFICSCSQIFRCQRDLYYVCNVYTVWRTNESLHSCQSTVRTCRETFQKVIHVWDDSCKTWLAAKEDLRYKHAVGKESAGFWIF